MSQLNTNFVHEFSYTPTPKETIAGTLTLEPTQKLGKTLTRAAHITTAGHDIQVQLYSNAASQQVLYLRQAKVTAGLAQTLGLSPQLIDRVITLPGQTLLSGARVKVFSQGVADMLQSPLFQQLVSQHTQTEIVIVPVLREGVKYQIAEMLLQTNDYYCEEVVVDAHHVIDQSVDGYGRRVDVTAFKDVDLTDAERQHIKVAIIGDSTASGIVIIGLLKKLVERFPNLRQVEVIAPLATLFACARIAHHLPADIQIRIHAFETLLNSVTPDFYWSPHFPNLNFHLQPKLQGAYRNWWGQDAHGNWIADTACAGYGWSEAFFHPQKFVRMMNGELTSRHKLTIAKIIERQLKKT